jgi:predicted nucleic acid-binding protein
LGGGPGILAERADITVVIVDTTVWIDFFSGRPSPEVQLLEGFLKGGRDICICGVILAEVLQGIREDKDYKRTLSRFDSFLFLDLDRAAFIRAAQIYRALRRRGITIRKSVDCMIAAVAIQHNLPLLHNDRDFDPIEKFCGLKVVT